ncbi:threonine synthase [Ekhidna sp.]
MKFLSTNNYRHSADFRDAVIKGLPDDNGLYFPSLIPKLKDEFLDSISGMKLHEIAVQVLLPFCVEDIPRDKLERICSETFVFDIPLKNVGDRIDCLELFHGPTMAFKDVGARFLARTLSHFKEFDDRSSTILVATSGDTGGAVASGFYNQPGIEVVILYPKGKVTALQERQMTTLGGNIQAIEIDGDFDDCQSIVKEAFLDNDLKGLNLSSANSINIARWLPQSIYYYVPFIEDGVNENLVFSVPSGNFGNITSGMLAKSMGLPIHRFIAATNVNDVVPRYLENGLFDPRKTIQTISNAMDVSKPSNFARLQSLYDNSHAAILNDTSGFVLNDSETRLVMSQCKSHKDYILDPHSAIAYEGLKNGLMEGESGVFLGTAHYCKFLDVVNDAINEELALPDETKPLFDRAKESIAMNNDYNDFKEFLTQ